MKQSLFSNSANLPPGMEPKVKAVLAAGSTGTTAPPVQEEDAGPVWGKKSTPTKDRVDNNDNTNPVKPPSKKRMTAAEKRAAGIVTKPRSKPSPKTAATSEGVSGVETPKEKDQKSQKSNSSQAEQAPSPPKPMRPINSATLDRLNQFLCAGENQDGNQIMKNETKQESTEEKAARQNIPVEQALADKLIVTDNQMNLKKKPISKMTKKEQLLARTKPNFLLTEIRVDKNKRKPDDPLFDPSSIFIPPEEFKTLTDGMQRYWEIKKDNMDKILLYRYGDWYVTYYEDTNICAKIMELTVTPHPGSPQVGFEFSNLDENIGKLTERGYKVAVCEQTETRDMMDKRLKEQMKVKLDKKKVDKIKKEEAIAAEKAKKAQQKLNPDVEMEDEVSENVGNTNQNLEESEIKNEEQEAIQKPQSAKKYDTTDTKAVRRVITNVYSKGTYNPSEDRVQLNLGRAKGGQKYDEMIGDGEQPIGVDQQELCGPSENLREKFDDRYIIVYCRDKNDKIGFVFYDISILHFYVGKFENPKTNVAEFRTLVQTLKPVEVVTLYSENHRDVVKLLRNMQQKPILTYLTQDKLPDIAKTDEMAKHYAAKNVAGDSIYPDGLEDMFQDFFDDHQVCLNAIGLSMKYMEDMMMGDITIPFASFRPYHGDTPDSFLNVQTNMVLDFATQEGLEIFSQQTEDEDNPNMEYNSLAELLDRTTTPFGRRLLRKWLCSPLTDIQQIVQRQSAITDLLKDFNVVKTFKQQMTKVKDLERMLARCYTYSIKSQQQIVYEELIWNLRLTEFRKTLQSLDLLLDIKVSLFEHCKNDFNCERLKDICTFKNITDPSAHITKDEDGADVQEDLRFQLEEENGLFHNFTPLLKPFQQCIEWEKVENDRFMPRPMKGMDDEIDEILLKMDQIKQQLKDYLSLCKQKFGCDKMTYASNRKYRFQLELPHEQCQHIDEDDDFFVTARLKHVRRYLSSDLTNLTTQLASEEVMYKARVSPLIRDMFERFYQNRQHWSTAVKCMAEIDALCALAEVSNDVNMVVPIVIPAQEKPYLKIRGMRHPLIEKKFAQNEFVPNDLDMDHDNKRTLLITGPNMGGKSTMLRTSCLIIIMAQMGCRVPADSCEFTVVDQIFTRVGASDKILENKSTFFLELEETKYIIDRATKHSIVIMDELGRGTSTFDGYSLAYSVLKYLTNYNMPRLMFTTHYHWLVDDFKDVQGVKLYTMLIDQNVVDEIAQDPQMYNPQNSVRQVDSNSKKVRFLYKFAPGVSLSSFGVTVAQMAGVQQSVLQRAEKISNAFALNVKQIRQQMEKVKLENK